MLRGIPASSGQGLAEAVVVESGSTDPNLVGNKEVILICSSLTPHQASTLNPKLVKGVLCEGGGRASHTSIIIRNLEIPAIMGCKGCTGFFSNGDMVFVDGSKGKAFAVTTESDLSLLQDRIVECRKMRAELIAGLSKSAITLDGKEIPLYANVGHLDDLKLVDRYGADGIGYFRTEFLFLMEKKVPDEDMQFEIYRKTVEQLNGKPVYFKTFDIGADNDVSFLKLPKEANPFLGWRGIRICLEERQLFKAQLRALFRASAYGNLKILVPMISSVTELRTVKLIVDEVKLELEQEGVDFDGGTEIGIVVEVPSAALCAESIIMEADFFTIGTNDLTQYTLAVDRTNEKVSGYYDFFNPAVLKLVKMTIDASHAHGKSTIMCGESAGDPVATLLLLGLGLDRFSMGPSALPKVKKVICSVSASYAEDIARTAMKMDTGQEIRQFLEGKLEEIGLADIVEL